MLNKTENLGGKEMFIWNTLKYFVTKLENICELEMVEMVSRSLNGLFILVLHYTTFLNFTQNCLALGRTSYVKKSQFDILILDSNISK